MYTHHVGKKSAMMITMILLVSTLAAVGFVCIETDASDAADTDCNNYYYSQLSPLAKSIYDGAKSADTFQTASWKLSSMTFSLDLDTTIPEADRESTYADAVAAVSDIYTIERVEEFWMGDSWSFTINGDKVDFTVSNIYTENNEETKSELIETQTDMYDDLRIMMDGIDLACRYTIIKSIHDAMDKECREEKPTEGSMKYRNAMNAFDFPYYGSAEGYAKAFKLACDYYKVPCIVVYGSLTIDGEITLSYWNYVQMEDGKWYLVNTFLDDNGWDTPFSNYLAVGSDSIGKSGSAVSAEMSPSSKLNVPALASTDYSKDRVMIRFIDYDGSYLPESNMYVKGSELNTALVAKYTNDNIGTFEFKGWDKSIPATATEDMTFKAQYTVQFVEYTYIFADENGTVIDSAKYRYGDKVVAPADPEKAPGKEVVYPFLEWLNYDNLAGYDVSKYPSGKTCTAAYYEVAVGTTFTSSYIQYQVNADGTVSIKEFEAKKSYYQSIPIRASCIVESDKTVSYAVTGFIAGAGLNYSGTYFVLDDSTGSTNPYFFTDKNGILYNGDKTILYACPVEKSSMSYTSPSSLVEVYPYAFAGRSTSERSGVDYFEFSEGLKIIGERAFQYCNLYDIVLPSTVEKIGSNLFNGAGGKQYYNPRTINVLLYMPKADMIDETVFANMTYGSLIIRTYDKNLKVDGATMEYMAKSVGETVTYGGITYEINSTDLGIGNRFHGVTAVSYDSTMTSINFGTYTMGWKVENSSNDTAIGGKVYYGETYICTDVNPDIFKTAPSIKKASVTISYGLTEMPTDIFSFLDTASFLLDSTFAGYIKENEYYALYGLDYTPNILFHGNTLVFASNDAKYFDGNLTGLIEAIADNAIRGTDDIQTILFSTDFKYLGKGNFDNLKFRNASDTKDISKTPESLAGKSFKRVDDHMVEVPTITVSFDTVYGYVEDGRGYSRIGYNQVPVGSVVAIDETKLTITDPDGNVKLTLTATARDYVPDCEFLSWSVKDGQVLDGSLTIEAKFKGKPYVYFTSMNDEYGYVNYASQFYAVGTVAKVNGNMLNIGGQNVSPVPRDGCAFEGWYYTDSTHVYAPLTSVTITESMYFIANFIGPCKVTFEGGFYGIVDTESINVAPGTTFTAKGNTITFSDGTTVTVTAKEAPEHSTVSFKAWSVASGTVSENMIISATFEVDVEKVEVTFKVNDPALGTVNGKSSDSFSAPYGSTYAYSETDAGYVLTFTYADETVFTATYAVVKAPEHFTNRFVAFQPASHGKITIAHEITGVFEQDVETFTVTVKSSDSEIGTVNYAKEIQILKVPYGATWNTDGVTFTLTEDDETSTVTANVKESPEHHTYAFAGWDKASGKVEGDTVITAQFTDTITKYKVNIHTNNEEYGSFVAEDTEVEYGSTWKYNSKTMMVEFDQPCGRIIGIGYVTHTDSKHYFYAFKKLSQMEGTVTGDLDLDATFIRGLQTYRVTIKTNDAEMGLIGAWSTVTTNFAYGTVYTINGNSVCFTCEEDHSDDDTLTANVVDPRDPQIINSFIGWNVPSGTIVDDGLVIIANFESKIGTITPDSKGDVSIDSKSADILIDSTALANIKNAGGELTVKLAEGTVSFDSAAVGKIGTAGSIAIGIVTDESITEKVKGAKVVSVDFGDNHDFKGGKITVTIPYAPAVGENINDICIGYVNGDKIEQISATYDTAGFVTFSVDHLSDFAVLHNDFFNEGGSGSGFPVAIVVVLVIVVLAAAGAFAFVKFKGMPNLKH